MDKRDFVAESNGRDCEHGNLARKCLTCELLREIADLESQLADRDAEIRENEGVIRVWRRRDEESRAEIERLNTAFDRVQRASEFVVAEDGRRIYDLTVEIERLRAKLDSEANHRLSLCADNERFVAEIERLRAELALRKDYADQCRAQDATIHRLKLELDAYERAVREARDGVR